MVTNHRIYSAFIITQSWRNVFFVVSIPTELQKKGGGGIKEKEFAERFQGICVCKRVSII